MSDTSFVASFDEAIGGSGFRAPEVVLDEAKKLRQIALSLADQRDRFEDLAAIATAKLKELEKLLTTFPSVPPAVREEAQNIIEAVDVTNIQWRSECAQCTAMGIEVQKLQFDLKQKLAERRWHVREIGALRSRCHGHDQAMSEMIDSYEKQIAQAEARSESDRHWATMLSARLSSGPEEELRALRAEVGALNDQLGVVDICQVAPLVDSLKQDSQRNKEWAYTLAKSMVALESERNNLKRQLQEFIDVGTAVQGQFLDCARSNTTPIGLLDQLLLKHGAGFLAETKKPIGAPFDEELK